MFIYVSGLGKPTETLVSTARLLSEKLNFINIHLLITLDLPSHPIHAGFPIADILTALFSGHPHLNNGSSVGRCAYT